MNETLVQSRPSPSDVRQIEQICDRFEAAWRAGRRPRLEEYLGQASKSFHLVVLRHLLSLDWEYRLRAGDSPRAVEYSVRFPAVAAVVEEIGREAAALVPDRPLPRQLGEYRVLREVGRGGMGVVYEATHEPSGQSVALKVLPGNILADPTARARFRREARTTARLDHPNIVPIHEVGEHDGQPFLILEFVAGPSLGDRLRDGPLSPTQAAALVETLARAVHHAHQQGIVHRDLKPANVLLAHVGLESSGLERPPAHSPAPLTEFVPKITDFGLAHRVGGHDLTATGHIIGTPGYMAPEQAYGKSKRQLVGPAADVYALGAILYATLTGRPPFQGITVLDALEKVRSQEPVPPTRLEPQVPRELEAVCLQCLEKEPGMRYASAEALADDLRRFQARLPVAARRMTHVGRLWRWCRRNPALVASCVLGVLTIVAAAGLAGSHAFTLRLRREQIQTTSALRDAERERVRAVQSAEELARQQKLTKAALARAEQFRWHAEHLCASLALERGLTSLEQGDAARGMLLLGHSLQITPAGAADLEHVIRSNLAAAARRLPFELYSVSEHGGEVWSTAFSPNGEFVLTGGRSGKPRKWDAATGEPVGPIVPHSGEVRSVAFSADGSLLATSGTDKTARLWKSDSGLPIGKPLAHAHWVQAVAFSPDGKTILTGSADGTARLWDVATGAPRGRLVPPGWIHAVAFSPDGKTIATAGSAHSAQLWDVLTLRPIGLPMRHQGEVWAVAFSPNGRVVATGSEDGTARLWEPDTGSSLLASLFHQGPVRTLGLSADGKILWTAGASGKVRLWDAARLQPIAAPVQHESAVYTVSLSPDRSRLATGSADGKVRLWQKPPHQRDGAILPHDRLVYCIALSPDGKTIATGSADPSLRLWDTATGLRRGKVITHRASILRAAFSPDGQTIATASTDKTARLWSAADGTAKERILEHADHVYAVAFSPNGQTILTGCKDSAARLWDAATGELQGEPLRHPGWVHAVAFSPDGKSILTGCEDGSARLWDVNTGKPLGEPLRHRGPVRSVAFSPDGRALVTGTWDDGTARLWDFATRKPLGPPLSHSEHVLAVAFSPDGKSVATGSWDGTARLWDVASGKPLGPPFVHQRSIRDVAFSPDGKTLWTASFDRTARSWELPVAAEGDVSRLVLWSQVVTGLELDPDGLFRALDAATWVDRRRLLTELAGRSSSRLSSHARAEHHDQSRREPPSSR